MFGCKGIEEDYRGWEGLNARQVKNPLNNAFQSPCGRGLTEEGLKGQPTLARSHVVLVAKWN